MINLVKELYKKNRKLALNVAKLYSIKVKSATLKNVDYEDIDRQKFLNMRKKAQEMDKKLFNAAAKRIVNLISTTEKADENLVMKWYGDYLKYQDTLGLLQKLYSEKNLYDKKLPEKVERIITEYERIRDKYMDLDLLFDDDELEDQGFFKHGYEHLKP